MTPKEKAKEMYDKMLNSDIMNMTKYCAKQCALIAVDEIINNVLIGIDLASTWGNYWFEVKNEIENL